MKWEEPVSDVCGKMKSFVMYATLVVHDFPFPAKDNNQRYLASYPGRASAVP
jgi:hypothetical protein